MRIPILICCGFLIVLMMVTYRRNQVWSSAETLWGDAHAKSPDHLRPILILGQLHHARGDVDGAVALDEHGLELCAARPFTRETFDELWCYAILTNLGTIAMDQNRLPLAEAAFHQVLLARPDVWQAELNLGVIALRSGRLADAHAWLDRIRPLDEEERLPLELNLGELARAERRCREAQIHYQFVQRWQPDFRAPACTEEP